MTVQRRLVVMRHAKAEPYATTDLARRLTDKGRRQAAEAGTRLRQRGLAPEHAVVSSAERARMTWLEVAAATGASIVPRLDDSVYSGGVDVVLETLHTIADDVATALFVGHNPTAAYLCHLLDDGEGDQAAVSGMLGGFPPGAFVAFEVSGDWADLGPDTGRVIDFFAPA